MGRKVLTDQRTVYSRFTCTRFLCDLFDNVVKDIIEKILLIIHVQDICDEN